MPLAAGGRRFRPLHGVAGEQGLTHCQYGVFVGPDGPPGAVADACLAVDGGSMPGGWVENGALWHGMPV